MRQWILFVLIVAAGVSFIHADGLPDAVPQPAPQPAPATQPPDDIGAPSTPVKPPELSLRPLPELDRPAQEPDLSDHEQRRFWGNLADLAEDLGNRINSNPGYATPAPPLPGESSPVPQQDATLPPEDVVAIVYPIRVQAGGQNFQCTAVSVGGNRFLTSAHLGSDIRGAGRYEVQIEGTWKTATFRPENGRDLAVVTVAGVNLPERQTRSPEFHEQVRVYGLATKQVMSGIVGTPEYIILDADETGVFPGDSGGCIVAESDGAIVGILGGFHAGDSKRNIPGEHRAVWFEGLSETQGYSAPATNGTRLIWFTATWCGPCRAFENTTVPDLQRRGWSVGTATSSDLQKVDIDSPSGKALMAELNFTPRQVPTFVVVRDGKVMQSVVGAVTANHLSAMREAK